MILSVRREFLRRFFPKPQFFKMILAPSPEQQMLGCSLSNFLADRRQQIISQWVEAVLRDRKVPAAEELTPNQLKDHIPQILDDLNRTLDDAMNQEIKARAAWRASIHGSIRWQQNYNISQLVEEISDLRAVLIFHLAEFHDNRTPTFSGENGVFAMIVLHTFFDRLIRISLEQLISVAKANERHE